jgi:hypothetical protein
MRGSPVSADAPHTIYGYRVTGPASIVWKNYRETKTPICAQKDRLTDVDASSMRFRGEYGDCSCRLSGGFHKIDVG